MRYACRMFTTSYPANFDFVRAVRDAEAGSIVATVALMAARGEAKDWPEAFRHTALQEYRKAESKS